MAQQVAIRLQARRAGVATGPEGEVPELELRCLGPFEVLQRGVPVPAESFTRSKALVLLKLLAVRMGAPVHREVLIEQLWPEVEPQLGANRLHGVVHDLRAVIEPHRSEREWRYIRSRGDFYYLDLGAPVELDLARFRRLVADGLRAGPEKEGDAIAGLETALGLYRGELLEDDPFAEWCEAERIELKEWHAKALLRVSELHARRGGTVEALGFLRRAERAAPFREAVIGAKMRLLAGLARTDEALAAYDGYERGLREELDARPSADLQELRRQLQRQPQRGR
jgi:DNA-binding SARP family transcriptional activator